MFTAMYGCYGHVPAARRSFSTYNDAVDFLVDQFRLGLRRKAALTAKGIVQLRQRDGYDCAWIIRDSGEGL